MTNPGTLLSGMYATAAIATERVTNAIAVPRDAIASRGGRRVVFTVDGADVHEVPITEGLSNATQVQVSTGIKPGDVLVADARRDIAPGTRVNPVFVK
jgi:multidrug efflux pump subunit AcrA (membrane-fusion protein)